MANTDMFGRQLNRGDLFFYAMRRCNSAEMAVGIVLEPYTGKVWQAKPQWTNKVVLNSRPGSIAMDFDRIVIVPSGTIPPELEKALKAKL